MVVKSKIFMRISIDFYQKLVLKHDIAVQTNFGSLYLLLNTTASL